MLKFIFIILIINTFFFTFKQLNKYIFNKCYDIIYIKIILNFEFYNN